MENIVWSFDSLKLIVGLLVALGVYFNPYTKKEGFKSFNSLGMFVSYGMLAVSLATLSLDSITSVLLSIVSSIVWSIDGIMFFLDAKEPVYKAPQAQSGKKL